MACPRSAPPLRRILGRSAASALMLAAALTAGPVAAAEPPADLTTLDYLELPELFQLSVVTGSMAVLRRWALETGDVAACECYDRWSEAEDVRAIVSLHARRNPAALRVGFADTLIAALAERCHQPARGGAASD